MNKLKTELELYQSFETDLKKNGIISIWPISEHILFLRETIATCEKQELCPHPVIDTEDTSYHRRPSYRRYCVICDKTIEEAYD